VVFSLHPLMGSASLISIASLSPRLLSAHPIGGSGRGKGSAGSDPGHAHAPTPLAAAGDRTAVFRRPWGGADSTGPSRLWQRSWPRDPRSSLRRRTDRTTSGAAAQGDPASTPPGALHWPSLPGTPGSSAADPAPADTWLRRRVSSHRNRRSSGFFASCTPRPVGHPLPHPAGDRHLPPATLISSANSRVLPDLNGPGCVQRPLHRSTQLSRDSILPSDPPVRG
jgi:hypothetical protein